MAEGQNLQPTKVIAQIFGVSTRRVEQLKTEGVIEGQGKPTKYDLLPTIKAYIKYLADKAYGREVKQTTAELEESKLRAEVDIKKAKAEAARLELKELQGKMHRAEDVEAIMTDHVLYLRSLLMAMPGKLAVDLSGTHTASEQADRVKTEVYWILENLSEYKYDPEAYKQREHSVEDGRLSCSMATRKRTRAIDRTFAKAFEQYKPPEPLTVSQWAEKYRVLSRESSAEAGPWRNARTPYMVEPMDAFTDPKVREIAVVAMSQVGKSEAELNMIGYMIDQDPGSSLYIQPNLDDAKKFSKLRIAPMLRDSPRLRRKVSDVKSRDSGNTVYQKTFPGGMLTIVGSQSPAALASTPARYVIGDEIDRWALSAGTEGDPWSLAGSFTN